MSEAHAIDVPNRRGPPSLYDPDLVEEIFELIAEGETITAICARPGMPSVAAFYVWLNARPAMQESYARAREVQAHVYASKIVDVANSATDAQLGRLKVDALKWVASKLSPREFGDSTQIRHADADGGKLNTQPLVSELLTLMGGGASQAPIESTARDVTPAKPSAFGKPLIGQTPAARPAYRPRRRDDVDDLV